MGLLQIRRDHFTHFRRKTDRRRSGWRCLVFATRRMHLMDLMEQELEDHEETIEIKICHDPRHDSGIYTATFFFRIKEDAHTFRTRHYSHPYCLVAGPIRITRHKPKEIMTRHDHEY